MESWFRYEAWILYNFLALCLAYVGGPGEVVVKCQGQNLEPSVMCCTCCLPKMPIDGIFIRRCKQGVLQFILAKPVLAIVTLVLYNIKDENNERKYEEGDWCANNGCPLTLCVLFDRVLGIYGFRFCTTSVIRWHFTLCWFSIKEPSRFWHLLTRC